MTGNSMIGNDFGKCKMGFKGENNSNRGFSQIHSGIAFTLRYSPHSAVKNFKIPEGEIFNGIHRDQEPAQALQEGGGSQSHTA
jgi:hypothetical protein